MSWNDGYERTQFKKSQEKLAIQYKQTGMSDEQINAMFQFDLDVFKNTRNYYRHNQSLSFDDSFDDETRNPLLAHFLDNICANAQPIQNKQFWWIEEIENESLYTVLKSLEFKDKLIITLLVFEGYSQSEIARDFLHTSPQNVSLRIAAIRTLLKPFINYKGGVQ